MVQDSEGCVDDAEETVVARVGEVGDDTINDSIENCLSEFKSFDLLWLTIWRSSRAVEQIASIVNSSISVGSSAKLSEVIQVDVLCSKVGCLGFPLRQIHASCCSMRRTKFVRLTRNVSMLPVQSVNVYSFGQKELLLPWCNLV